MAIMAALHFKMLIAPTRQPHSEYSGSDPASHRQRQSPLFPPQVAIVPQQRHLPSLSPRVRHNGGCSRACRHLLWRKIRNLAAVPGFPAVPSGGNFANCAIRPPLRLTAII
jgi:hypothetical protein